MFDVVAPEAVGMNGEQLARAGEHLRKRFVEPTKIPGSIALVARRGQVCYVDVAGKRDLERDTPMTADTLFRIFSMTKPVTSVALMTLYERGLFSMDDPVQNYIPAWKNLRVHSSGTLPMFVTRRCDRPMTIRDLFRHTSGLTYDFMHATNVDAAYREVKLGQIRSGYTLQEMIDQLAQLPLEFSPGERWNYSVATDVLGYLIEVISGQSLPDFLQEIMFEPLGMVDTSFEISADKVSRLASCYARDANKQLVLVADGQHSDYVGRSFWSGGGGLLSTAHDYYRFCQMLLNGGSLDGHRIIGARTLDFMTKNHLPGGADLSQLAVGSFSETIYDGVGFGLGFATKLNPVANGFPGSTGSFYWGGAASTLFWVDPVEELVVIFLTQLLPSGTFNFRGQLENIIYAALERD